MIRLLKRSADGFELKSFKEEEGFPLYAILSHTWTEGEEVTYQDLVTGAGKDKTGYAKIEFCATKAADDGLEYCWVDTCCIDKSTSDELSTAINSMFRWYQRASKCYAYLTDVQVPDEVTDPQEFRITWDDAFRRSRWFTRGWTLQELLAPPTVEFFSKEGKRLGSKVSLEKEVHEITGIPIPALRGWKLSEFDVEERKNWAAKRKTTKPEDKVYCLLGMFNVYLPLIYGEGELHATKRLDKEIEQGNEGHQLRPPTALSVSSLFPFPRNEFFVGQQFYLRALELYLFEISPKTHRRLSIHGLGGCGKSALALEFAYRTRNKHKRLVLWMPALSRNHFESAYREIGVLLQIPGITEKNADIKTLVKQTLSSGRVGKWLMIVDNADDPSVLLSGDAAGNEKPLIDSLPQSDDGVILFTSRNRKAVESFTPASVLEIKTIDKSVAKELLARRITRKTILGDATAVDSLLKLLECLPLAIVQAAAFINTNDTSVSEYVSLFEHPGAEFDLFSRQFEDASRYREMDSTVARTWHISFDQIRRRDKLAAFYLSFIGCIDRINIPKSLLSLGETPVDQTTALGTLKAYAFITERQRNPNEAMGEVFYDMHRLVHLSSVGWLECNGKRVQWASLATSRLTKLLPMQGHQFKELWAAYMPHAMYLARVADFVDGERRASLLDRLGRAQIILGEWSGAATSHTQALRLREEVLGLTHPSTIESMNEVGQALGELALYKEAEIHFQRACEVLTEKMPHAKVPEELMVRTMSNLAITQGDQGNYKEAESIFRDLVAMSETMHGPGHWSTVEFTANLAASLAKQNKHKEGELVALKALRLALPHEAFGPENPVTLGILTNLAIMLDGQGKEKDAEPILRQALEGVEKACGPNHTTTLRCVQNLAAVLITLGRYDEALVLRKRAWSGYAKALGEDHPTTRDMRERYFKALSRYGPRPESPD